MGAAHGAGGAGVLYALGVTGWRIGGCKSTARKSERQGAHENPVLHGKCLRICIVMLLFPVPIAAIPGMSFGFLLAKERMVDR